MVRSSLIETLETRQLLSCSSAAAKLLDDGTLRIRGSKGADDISVALDAVNSMYVVTLNGSTKSFDSTLVKSIKIDGGKGADRLAADESGGLLGVALSLYGDKGNDTLIGGSLDDVLRGGKGADELYGSSGNDSMNGDHGADLLVGEDGDDVMHGGCGNDTLMGSGGNDSLFGDQGSDALFGEFDNDYLHGGKGDDSLEGGDGDDDLIGGKGIDSIFGNDGSDTGHTSDDVSEWKDSQEITIDDKPVKKTKKLK